MTRSLPSPLVRSCVGIVNHDEARHDGAETYSSLEVDRPVRLNPKAVTGDHQNASSRPARLDPDSLSLVAVGVDVDITHQDIVVVTNPNYGQLPGGGEVNNGIRDGVTLRPHENGRKVSLRGRANRC